MGSVLYKTANSGTNWVYENTSDYVNDSYFINTSTGWVVRSQTPFIIKTTNSGLNWIAQSIPVSENMNAVMFINSDTGYAGSTTGTILFTSNGGDTWVRQITNSHKRINRIYFFDFNNGYIFGDNGMILRTTTGGTTFISNNNYDLPDRFSLSQNYPNPFNPITKIDFELPKNAKVKLIIYNVLGKEIMKLVNDEFKTAGKYTVDFNGSNLASGVYFYRLETKDFISTKRMLLLK